MGFFDKLAGGAANMLLNSDMVLDAINGYVDRYATVKRITKQDKCFTIEAQPAGSNELLTVVVGDISIADDNSSVSIGSLSANLPWAEHALQDFVQGRKIAVPESVRGVLGKVKTVL